MTKFDEIIEISGNKLTSKYIESLNRDGREALIEPIFRFFRAYGFPQPDDYEKSRREYKRLCDYKVDLNSNELYNNDSVATSICKLFCKSFYLATEPGKKNMVELFDDDNILRKLIRNRLGLDWYPNVTDEELKTHSENESFNFSPKMLIQGMRSTRVINQVSMFKPTIAKYIYMKYSNENDLVYDFSAGFGGRMLGAASCNRKYVGVDPLNIKYLEEMRDYLGLKNCTLISDVSENFCLEKDSIDLAFSSPPYKDLEQYSLDKTQAYNHHYYVGENGSYGAEAYFYEVYWNNTLKNIYYMLKPGKVFALNVKNYPKMVDMAKEFFGEYKEEVYLKTVRSHLNKTAGTIKYESIYIFVKK
jgi:DNA modification methylase